MYKRFGLTLMVTQACNLNCRYCYIVHEDREMTQEVAERAILCAVGSIEQGGLLELGFFGGEPFLACQKITSMIRFAKDQTAGRGIDLSLSITTNGTLLNSDVWSIINEPTLRLSVSIDGRPETQNRNRFFPNGEGSYEIVERTIQSLVDRNIRFNTVAVVGPDTVGTIDDEIGHLRRLRCRDIELSLDVWASWGPESMAELRKSISRCSRLWLEGLPEYTLNWFDDKAAMLMNPPVKPSVCGFGKGDITVTPRGHLYPCERLVADDSDDNPMRLRGDVFERDDFLFGPCYDLRTAAECVSCGIKDACNTTCGCCNYTRTGAAGQPDKLLCLFNQWCLNETEKVIEKGLNIIKGE